VPKEDKPLGDASRLGEGDPEADDPREVSGAATGGGGGVPREKGMRGGGAGKAWWRNEEVKAKG